MSSAPHVRGTLTAVMLAPGVGVMHCPPLYRPIAFEQDQLCHFTHGRAAFSRPGERVEVEPGTLVHFKSGWTGWLHVAEPVAMAFMQTPGASGPCSILHQVAQVEPLKDWGALGESSRVTGTLLSRDPDGRSESGLWICTPGAWDCHVTRDEFCHFLLGRCTYRHESGDVIEVEPDTVAFFPQDWKGTCTVHETIRKVYLIR